MVIAKSDMVILVVSVSLLAAGINRWQNNVSRAHERRAVTSSPAAIQGGNSQRSNTNSLAAKPANVARDAGAATVAPVESNFGNTGQTNTAQPSTQNAVVAAVTTDSQASTNTTTDQPLYGTYEVKSGDTLSKIATDYGTTVDTLRTINDISGSLITVGQNVRYPLPAN